MNYRDYQNARDAAWRILLDCGIDRLPVDLNIICRELGVKVLSYQKAARLIEKRNLEWITKDSDGLTFYADDLPVILYNSACPPGRVRFTVAHELGHLILMHVTPGVFLVERRELLPEKQPKEVAANQFAARLLAPACVLWGLDLHTAEEIREVCHISEQAALHRADRMRVLYKRGRFLTSPLERELYQRFEPFITKREAPGAEGVQRDVTGAGCRSDRR